MTIVPTTLSEEPTYRSAVTLSHYAKAVQYTECSMYGVNNPADRLPVGDQCRDIWTLQQRNYIQRYLTEAQIELENETNMVFGSTWITGLRNTPNERLTDIQTYRANQYYYNYFCNKPVLYTRWNNVRALGKLVVETVELAASVSHVADPATITVTIDPLVVTDIYKVRIFEAGNYGTSKQISLNPSDITITGASMTITIPRCRMVKYDLRNNPVEGLDYTDTANFIDEVDVYYYTTVNSNSLVITKSNCNCGTREVNTCLEQVTVGLSTVRARQDCGFCPCTCPKEDIYAGLWYEAGDPIVNQQQIDLVIRLAHAKMPDEPCGCETAQRMWERDRNIPELLTPERYNNPFGMRDGHWVAYQWARQMTKPRFGHM